MQAAYTLPRYPLFCFSNMLMCSAPKKQKSLLMCSSAVQGIVLNQHKMPRRGKEMKACRQGPLNTSSNTVRAIACLEVKAYKSPSKRLLGLKLFAIRICFQACMVNVGVVYGCFGTFSSRTFVDYKGRRPHAFSRSRCPGQSQGSSPPSQFW